MTKPRVSIIDYGAGNLLSLSRAFMAVDAEPSFVSRSEDVQAAEFLVLPGVGAFGSAMQALRQRNLVEPIRSYVERGGAFLGICLGMQMMMDRSSEFGIHEGLGLFRGDIAPINNVAVDGTLLKVPHVGWSPLLVNDGADWPATGLQVIDPGASAYFVHSFAATMENPQECLAYCEYGGRRICAVIARGSAMGCQFHPEKSGPMGLAILRQFAGAQPSEGITK